MLWHFEWFFNLYNSRVGNDNSLLWLIAGVGFGRFDLLDNVHTFNDFAKDDVTTVQPLGLDSSDKELRSIGIFSSICLKWRRIKR